MRMFQKVEQEFKVTQLVSDMFGGPTLGEGELIETHYTNTIESFQCGGCGQPITKKNMKYCLKQG